MCTICQSYIKVHKQFTEINIDVYLNYVRFYAPCSSCAYIGYDRFEFLEHDIVITNDILFTNLVYLSSRNSLDGWMFAFMYRFNNHQPGQGSKWKFERKRLAATKLIHVSNAAPQTSAVVRFVAGGW